MTRGPVRNAPGLASPASSSPLLRLLVVGRLVGVRRCEYSLLPPLPRA
ncbi:MAG: hypothetical protein JNM10_08685 [Planctomycetia bacterium]|nr:hypothetical protein [Planctomycetia bacterium]